jgi:hypothetical protein
MSQVKAHVTKQKEQITARTEGDRTLLVAGGEEDAAGLVADEALGDPGGPRRRAGSGSAGAALLEDCLGAEHLGDERVAGRAGLELVHLDEHRLPLRRRRGHWDEG